MVMATTEWVIFARVHGHKKETYPEQEKTWWHGKWILILWVLDSKHQQRQKKALLVSSYNFVILTDSMKS